MGRFSALLGAGLCGPVALFRTDRERAVGAWVMRLPLIFFLSRMSYIDACAAYVVVDWRDEDSCWLVDRGSRGFELLGGEGMGCGCGQATDDV